MSSCSRVWAACIGSYVPHSATQGALTLEYEFILSSLGGLLWISRLGTPILWGMSPYLRVWAPTPASERPPRADGGARGGRAPGQAAPAPEPEPPEPEFPEQELQPAAVAPLRRGRRARGRARERSGTRRGLLIENSDIKIEAANNKGTPEGH